MSSLTSSSSAAGRPRRASRPSLTRTARPTPLCAASRARRAAAAPRVSAALRGVGAPAAGRCAWRRGAQDRVAEWDRADLRGHCRALRPFLPLTRGAHEGAARNGLRTLPAIMNRERAQAAGRGHRPTDAKTQNNADYEPATTAMIGSRRVPSGRIGGDANSAGSRTARCATANTSSATLQGRRLDSSSSPQRTPALLERECSA